jgi:hypothetical protein
MDKTCIVFHVHVNWNVYGNWMNVGWNKQQSMNDGKWMNFIPKIKEGNHITYEMKKETMNVWNKIYSHFCITLV